MIGLINYGSGNIYAIANIYKKLDIPFIMSNDTNELAKADKLVLPGVGAFDETMDLLHKNNLKVWLDEAVMERKVPIIGVCVGMQIMAKSSDEGDRDGFGWIDAHVRKLDISLLDQKPHLPHLGWNVANPKNENPLFNNVDIVKGFYFLHTYYFDCNHKEDVVAITDYGNHFASVVNSENVYGVQFHPEKSHQNGIEIFKNFANL